MENIEQLIFDYHEGNLSDADKAELLNLIHQNPEYEKDFALWAQTYAHVPNNVPDYGLTGLLLQKAPPVWYSQYWLSLSIGTLSFIFGIIGFLAWLNQKDNNLSSRPKKEYRSPILAADPLGKSQIISSRHTISPKKKQITKANTKVIPTIDPLKENIVPINEEVFSVIPIVEHNEKKQETIPANIVQADTTAKTPQINNQTTNEEKMKSKPKRKLPLNLKPSPDFMPVNPNF